MFVCEKCHEQDRRVTKCDLDIESHGLLRIRGSCGICGKSGSKLMWCHYYEVIRRNKSSSKKGNNDLSINH